MRSEGWLALGDRPETEVELRSGDLFVRVLVPALEAREAGDAHDEQAVARAHLDRRRLRGDRDLDAEAGGHDLDRRLVRRVQAELHAFGQNRLRLFGRERTLRDRAVRGEHRGCDAEAEERLAHWKSFFPLESGVPYTRQSDVGHFAFERILV